MNQATFATKQIVCLGGGIGTSNLVRGLSRYTEKLSIVVSMADEGGSSGRLRRLYGTMPPGDIISSLAALLEKDDPLSAKLLTYRFPGDRYGKDDNIGGQKLGNLLMVAAQNLTGSFEEAARYVRDVYHIKGNVYPATNEHVALNAKTIEGEIVEGEERIDRGEYKGKRILDHVYLDPRVPNASPGALRAIQEADIIIGGPGDLYTNLLPVLIVPEITKAVLQSKAKKLYVVNVANKPFETKDYGVYDFIKGIIDHIGSFPFDTLIVNDNQIPHIPDEYHYSYVPLRNEQALLPYKKHMVLANLINDDFPIYHDPKKLASVILETI